MSKYKFTYYNFTGVGEPVRMVLHYGGVEFEDKRIEYEDWPKFKDQSPMGQLPLLEIDGKVYHQHRAFGRYLAKKFKLYGFDDLEDIAIDACIDDFDECRYDVAVRYFLEEDANQKAKLKKIGFEKADFYFKKFEDRVKNNGGYYVNNKLTWADIYFVANIEVICNIHEKDFLRDYPALKKLNETVRAIPRIKSYLATRPKTRL